MHRLLKPFRLAALLAAAAFVPACADDEAQDTGSDEAIDAPVENLAVLLEGAPNNADLPDEAKADQVFPKQFDLVATQSPVKSQGSRGVCSIFSTVALMEHLYLKEGTLAEPDFSEQFLQWSVKMEVGSFPKTSGSNATSNIEAINRFGIVEESVFPYQTQPWTAANDPRCAGDDLPTICHTNGEPPAEVLSATRWKLPRSRWISSRRENIKAYMFENKRAVVAGMQFFYQSWDHGGSPYAVNPDYKAKGYVLYPNDDDKKHGTEKQAGHSILIVGWDDDLEVPRIDKDGKPMLDAQGNPLTEKGFFLFKNSWGTGTFGRANPKGAGYGWLSMRYVEEFGSVTSTAEPELNLGPEVCNDGVDNNGDRRVDCDDPKCAQDAACQAEPEVCNDSEDNDRDGAIDCADSDCAEDAACQPVEGGLSGENTEGQDIPDNDLNGILSAITLSGEGTIAQVLVDVNITHSYRGDLKVTLHHPDGTTVVLSDRAGRNEVDLIQTFDVAGLAGKPGAGEWFLEVNDNASQDTGRLNSWAIRVVTE